MAVGREDEVIRKLSAELYLKLLDARDEMEIYRDINQYISMALTAGKDRFGNTKSIILSVGDKEMVMLPSIEVAADYTGLTVHAIRGILNKEEGFKGLTFKKAI